MVSGSTLTLLCMTPGLDVCLATHVSNADTAHALFWHQATSDIHHVGANMITVGQDLHGLNLISHAELLPASTQGSTSVLKHRPANPHFAVTDCSFTFIRLLRMGLQNMPWVGLTSG